MFRWGTVDRSSLTDMHIFPSAAPLLLDGVFCPARTLTWTVTLNSGAMKLKDWIFRFHGTTVVDFVCVDSLFSAYPALDVVLSVTNRWGSSLR
ncbi:hypothetical protein M404DRAFT_532949 [Pisolithus tinctorius Marx 270]|uniref:Uncharacterized protein n=1 Tax=Pisolithus tinctorius Marx 270 TaxID=870435 RepID=A0A0C3PBJ6_PISTI|nr:hypothetical protein M404DRAFT_532949 [Pisolithus tinctorius Marx 270]